MVQMLCPFCLSSNSSLCHSSSFLSPKECPHANPPHSWVLRFPQGQVFLFSLRPDQVIFGYICVRGLRPASLCCLIDGLVSERSQGSKLVETAGLPMGSPSSTTSSSLSLIQPQGSLASVHQLGISICICLRLTRTLNTNPCPIVDLIEVDPEVEA